MESKKNHFSRMLIGIMALIALGAGVAAKFHFGNKRWASDKNTGH
jgi:hypothetical protein